MAVSYCKKGRGLIKINGCPIELVEPEILRYKVFEPILLLENVPEFVTMGAQGLTPAMWSQLRELGYYCTILIASARYFDCAVRRAASTATL